MRLTENMRFTKLSSSNTKSNYYYIVTDVNELALIVYIFSYVL